MAARPPLPFGLGRDPQCAPNRCLSPDTPLPAPGTPLHDQIASALSQLFQTFFSTSLRYLGVSEILDWLETSGTVDAWILSGLEGGRLPDEIADERNLAFGKEAFRQVVKNALDADGGAWATSLRETGFSSAMSMAFEGVIAQLKPSKTAPLPCLHTLLTPTGLSMLKSAPLKSTFPLSPPRTSPSPAPLLASIRSLIQSGNLVDPVWQSTTTWRSQIRKAFASYHALMRQVAEEIVSDRSFAEEYFIFLENVSRPVQLLQLIADDFEAEFGPNATRGLLGVGDVGGDNLISIMDFCAAKKPSELLKRVKQRVAEKQERDRRSMQFESLRERLKELDAKVKSWLLKYRSAIGKKDKGEGEGEEDVEGDGEQVDVVYEEDAVRLQRELEETLDERDKIKSELDDLQAKQEEDERAVKRERAERQKLRRAAGVDEETGEAGFKLGSSKDLLVPTAAGDIALDPFSSIAPRAVSPVPGSAKGKARALTHPGKPRTAARYAPPPPAHRYNTPLDRLPKDVARSASPAFPPTATPDSSRPSSPAPRTRAQKRSSSAPPAAGSASSSPSRARKTRAGRSKLSKRKAEGEAEVEDDGYCELCCPLCRAEAETMAKQDGAETLVEPAESEQMSRTGSAETAVEVAAHDQADHQELAQDMPLQEATNTPPTSSSGKKKKKRKNKNANTVISSVVIPAPPPPTTATLTIPPSVSSTLPTSLPSVPLKEGFSPLSKYPPPRTCPPHRCTGVPPKYEVWEEMDGLLYGTLLAGFKYELIGALPSPLFLLRDKCAKSYLLGGGRMTTDTGEPREMDGFLELAEARGLWHSVNHAEIQAWGQRVLAISMQKLVDVLVATLGDICICKMSNHLDILREAQQRLEQCEQLDRQIPIDLPEIDPTQFMKWCHVQLRAKRLSGPEWESVSRQYVVQDYLLSFSDAFDAAMDRLMLNDPFVLAEDMCTLLEWQGGVRAFETALRFGRGNIVDAFGTGVELLEGKEEGPVERRPLQAWGRLLELSAEARAKGTPFSRDLAEQEKQKGNDFFAAGEFEKAVVSFTTASIIHPSEPTFAANAAAARMKLNTPEQYAEAVSDCTIALYSDPTHIKALYRRGVCLAMLGQWKAAFADLRHLDQIAPDCEPARQALAWAEARHRAVTTAKVK
ncbi:hypothetical protein JCM10049v2_006629 [Rhodotorula toruloides]